MRIDSHHSCSERYPLAHLESILKRNRFEGSILVSTDGERSECGFVKGVVARVEQPLRAEAVACLSQKPWIRGVCLRAGNSVPEGLYLVQQRGLSLDLEGGLEVLPAIAEQFPGLRVAIDHLGAVDGISDFDAWAACVDRAASYPRIYCKASGLVRLGSLARACVRHALDRFGPARMMFGSDWPHSLPDFTWKANLAAFTQAIGAQPIEVREELLGGTAARFYAI